MAGIHYLTGDATEPVGEGPKIIPHICNNIGGWGRGFVLALSAKWPQPEASYRRWSKDPDQFYLGEVQYVPVAHNLMVANMIAQENVIWQRGVPPIRYGALASCLGKVAKVAKHSGCTLHMPRIGCGLAGGKWDVVETLIQEIIIREEIDVYVYDLLTV
jgi:O-acetyl-ADP-ribose deacetylase (regulator of RNase III)